MQLNIEDDKTNKLALAFAIEEKRRRIRENGIRYYVPLQEAKDENPSDKFHKSKKRIRAIFGGNRSSKTVSGACEAVWYATGTHPYKSIPVPNFGRIVCTDFVNGIEKVIIPEIKKWLPRNAVKPGKAGYNAESRTIFLKNGSTIEFMSYDQDVEKFASASRHWIWFDEEPSQDIFLECKMRVLDTKGDIWFTETPVNGMTWIYSDIYEKSDFDPNIEVFHFDTRKNPYIDKEVLEELTKGLSDAEIDMRLGGKFVSLSGMIYPGYNPLTHRISKFPMPSHWPRVCSIDPHPRLSTMVLYVAVAPTSQFIKICEKFSIPLPEINDDEVYIAYDEIYPDEKTLLAHVCSMMRAKEGMDRIMYRLIDSIANQPNQQTGTTLRQDLERNYNIRTIVADKDVPNGIIKVRDRLDKNSLFFMNHLHNLDWEIRHYVWDDYKIGRDYKDPKEKPRKKRDHLMDNLRYICSSCPRYIQPVVYRPRRTSVCSMTGY